MLHGVKPNALLQLDYLKLGAIKRGCKYVVIRRDDQSNYYWLLPFAGTGREDAAQAIVIECGVFGTPEGLMYDGPTHFRNEKVRLFTTVLRTVHHLTLPECRWSNRTVERLRRESFGVAPAFLSEL